MKTVLIFAVAVSILPLSQAGRAMAPLQTADLEAQLKYAVELTPDAFEANYNLGEFYLHAGRIPEGIPYLKKALILRPAHYVSGYDLALAYFETRNYPKAKEQILAMLGLGDSAELHGLLADVEEAAGDYVAAVHEYERAARMEPGEEHIFDWGSELLRHQTLEAATAVFSRGVELFPQSAKLHAGLGIALYLRGSNEDAVSALCTSTDLEPTESWPYVFLAKIYNVSTANAEEVRSRLARFARLQPKNPQALVYYAISLSAQERIPAALTKIESLLKDAAALDPAYCDPHLHLGILYADQQRYEEAVREFKQAIALQPNLTTAHYRLAQAYLRTGDKAGSARELQVFAALRRQDIADAEKERKEIRQFVTEMKAAR